MVDWIVSRGSSIAKKSKSNYFKAKKRGRRDDHLTAGDAFKADPETEIRTSIPSKQKQKRESKKNGRMFLFYFDAASKVCFRSAGSKKWCREKSPKVKSSNEISLFKN